MITLYHGTTEIIEFPRVDAGRLGLDFGPGFYVTKILGQAEKWAQRYYRCVPCIGRIVKAQPQPPDLFSEFGYSQ